ncbi:MAG: SAM-dependent methyltransferase [Acidobacteria bacterium]|nr:MAG: SAM-dependent methyltransferase [Acidobacteriota bacterium]
MSSDPLVRNVSDTALWAAAYRARENDRPNPLFRDPFARRLAGTRGLRIAETLTASDSWAWVTRTYLFDRFIRERIAQDTDTVVNLAAGLDSRPYRMDLPAALRWIEVDLPDLLAYKEEALAGEKPRCALERIALDLSDAAARRSLFERLGGAGNALVVTEGLLIYLTAEEVAMLAGDLTRPAAFRHWVLDLVSPGLLRMLQKKTKGELDAAGAPLKFGPAEGPGFFQTYGWRSVEVASIIQSAAKLKQLSFGMRLIAMLPQSDGPQGSRPWGGVCLLEREQRPPR